MTPWTPEEELISLEVGTIVAIATPRIECVNPKKRTTTGELQPFRIDGPYDPETGNIPLGLATGEAPTVLLHLTKGVKYS